MSNLKTYKSQSPWSVIPLLGLIYPVCSSTDKKETKSTWTNEWECDNTLPHTHRLTFRNFQQGKLLVRLFVPLLMQSLLKPNYALGRCYGKAQGWRCPLSLCSAFEWYQEVADGKAELWEEPQCYLEPFQTAMPSELQRIIIFVSLPQYQASGLVTIGFAKDKKMCRGKLWEG